jgi:endonuclease/exonuclease/phosphatase family metal-dependent hydrolase
MKARLAGVAASGRIAFDLIHTLLRPRVLAASDAEDVITLERPGKRLAGRKASEDDPLKLVSWNIHRNYRSQRICSSLSRIIERVNPDVLLLQEVPVYPKAPFWELDGLRDLLSEFDIVFAAMHEVKRRSSYYPFDRTGVATASKLKIRDFQVIPLPTVSRPKLGRNHDVNRVAVSTILDVGGIEVQVANAHLENTTGPRGRELQIRHLLKYLSPVVAPIILGGDFNTFFGSLERVQEVAGSDGFEQAARRGSGFLPLVDHFFVRGCEFASYETLRESGSDHRPIALEVIPRCNPVP